MFSFLGGDPLGARARRKGPRSGRGRALALALAASITACAPTALGSRLPPQRLPRPSQTVEVPPELAIPELETTLRRNPADPNARLGLAQAYFRLAQRALESGDQQRYTTRLARAQRELLTHMERVPADPRAHIQLGILAAYRGDFDGSRRSFRIAAQLDPVDPIAHQNLAELAIYEDDLPEVRRRLRLARSRGIPEAEAQLIEALSAWKQEDLIEAKRLFGVAKGTEPERVRTWNGASRIETFDDLAAHCCKLRFCGPYMVRACGDMNQAVAEQQLEEETILKELQLEMERARRVREIYERRQDLEIKVDEEDAGDSDQPRSDSPGAGER